MIKPFIKKLANWEWLNAHITDTLKNPYAIARVLVVANVIKDAVGSVFYVTQSYNNQKMPEDKRKLVAALDLANGIAMCTLQLVLGFTISDKAVQKKITSKLFGSFEHTNPAKFLTCKTGFAAITSLVISTIIAKRIITPLVTTPMAFKIKEKYIDKTENLPQINVGQLKKYNPVNVYTHKHKPNFSSYRDRYNNPLTIQSYIDSFKI